MQVKDAMSAILYWLKVASAFFLLIKIFKEAINDDKRERNAFKSYLKRAAAAHVSHYAIFSNYPRGVYTKTERQTPPGQ